MGRRLLHVGILLLVGWTAQSQSRSPVDSLDRSTIVLEDYLDLSSVDLEGQADVEALAELLEEGVDINTAGFTELQCVPGIDPTIAQEILDTRRRHPFRSLVELRRVNGISEDLYDRISPFLRLNPSRQGAAPAEFRWRARTSGEMERRTGYLDGSYPGSNVRIYNRLDARSSWFELPGGAPSGRVTGGVLTEKDPGELRFADFITAYVMIETSNAWRVLVGDFAMDAGQGLTFARGHGLGFTADVLGVARDRGGGFTPYRSSDENALYRGVAVTAPLAVGRAEVFYSNRRLNARVDSLGMITSFDAQGLFRTASELKRKGASREETTGFRIASALMERLSIGVNGVRTTFGDPVAPAALTGAVRSVAQSGSVDLRYSSEVWSSGGEVSVTGEGRSAVVATAVCRPVDRFSLGGGIRWYDRGFETYRGALFSGADGKGTAGGVYVSAAVSPADDATLQGYYDISYGYPDAGGGTFSTARRDWFTQGRIGIGKDVQLEARTRLRTNPEQVILITPGGLVEWSEKTERKWDVRFTVDVRPASRFLSRTRLEASTARLGTPARSEHGLLISEELQFGIWSAVDVSTRFALFDTDSYETRMYQMERDVQGSFSNPPLYGKGVRWYVLARFRVLVNVRLSAKYALLSKEEVTSLYSGEDLIDGRQDGTLTLQLDCRL